MKKVFFFIILSLMANYVKSQFAEDIYCAKTIYTKDWLFYCKNNSTFRLFLDNYIQGTYTAVIYINPVNNCMIGFKELHTFNRHIDSLVIDSFQYLEFLPLEGEKCESPDTLKAYFQFRLSRF